jgi:hypothetical protein
MNSTTQTVGASEDAPFLNRLRNAPPWAREPLLHFLVLGAVLFAVDYVVVGRANDPTAIVVDGAVDREALRIFREQKGRAPNADELYALRRIWLDNEVLYREGLALKLDQGDPAIRDRVIFKALTVVEAGLKLPPYDDDLLRGWFEKNRVKYDEPPRYDFEEAVIAGDPSESAARELASALNEGTQSDIEAGLRIFKARPLPTIVQSYGPEFADALQRASVGEWEPLRHRDGWRVIRVGDRLPAKAADFDSIRGLVLQDWTDATMAELRTEAVRALAKKYTVMVEAGSP